MTIKRVLNIGVKTAIFIIISTDTSIAGWGQQAFYPGGHMMGSGYMGWMMILFWAMLLLMLILVIRWVLRATQFKSSSQTPLDVLKNRLANGEIDIEEFKEKRQFL